MELKLVEEISRYMSLSKDALIEKGGDLTPSI